MTPEQCISGAASGQIGIWIWIWIVVANLQQDITATKETRK